MSQWTLNPLVLALGSTLALVGCGGGGSSSDESSGGGGVVIEQPDLGGDTGNGGGDSGEDTPLVDPEPQEQLQVLYNEVTFGDSDRICQASGVGVQVHGPDGSFKTMVTASGQGIVDLSGISDSDYLTVVDDGDVADLGAGLQVLSIQRGLIDDSYELTLRQYAGDTTNCQLEDTDTIPDTFNLTVNGGEDLDFVDVKPSLAVFGTNDNRFGIRVSSEPQDLLATGYRFDGNGDMILGRYVYAEDIQADQFDEVSVTLSETPTELVKPVESDLVDLESRWLHPETGRSHSLEIRLIPGASLTSTVKTVNVGEGALHVRRLYEEGVTGMLSVENYPNMGFPVPEATETVATILPATYSSGSVNYDLLTPSEPAIEITFEREYLVNASADGNTAVTHKVYTTDLDGDFTFPNISSAISGSPHTVSSTPYEELAINLATTGETDPALWVRSRDMTALSLRPTDDALLRALGEEVTTVSEAQRQILNRYNANRVIYTRTQAIDPI